MRYENYEDAHRYATLRANETGLDVAIRRVREYGRDGYNVTFAARMDSDYARAEIIRPDKQ